MKFLSILAIVPLAIAQSSTSSSAGSAASTSTSPEYTITALPQVISAPSCIFNCLIPIGLADPSGCDDVTNDCACLSAPADVLDVLTGCVQTVCKSSTSAFAASATNLYLSYCNSLYGGAVFTSALSSEAAAAAMSSTMETMSGSMSMPAATESRTSTSSAPTTSGTAKSDSSSWSPSLLTTGLAVGGLLCMVAL